MKSSLRSRFRAPATRIQAKSTTTALVCLGGRQSPAEGVPAASFAGNTLNRKNRALSRSLKVRLHLRADWLAIRDYDPDEHGAGLFPSQSLIQTIDRPPRLLRA